MQLQSCTVQTQCTHLRIHAECHTLFRQLLDLPLQALILCLERQPLLLQLWQALLMLLLQSVASVCLLITCGCTSQA
jgi:hypothetical protein